MTAASPPTLTEKQLAIIGTLAKSFAASAGLPRTLSKQDYFQTGCLAALKAASKRSEAINDLLVHIAARHAMLGLLTSVNADDRRRATIDADPLRPRSLPSPFTAEALDAADALDQLDDEQRRIIIGRYWEGRVDREIAVEMGLTVDQVHTRAQKAIRALKDVLAPSYRDEYAKKHPRKYGWRIYDAKRPLKAQAP